MTVGEVEATLRLKDEMSPALKHAGEAAHELGEHTSFMGAIMNDVFGSWPAKIAEGVLLRDMAHELIDKFKEAAVEFAITGSEVNTAHDALVRLSGGVEQASGVLERMKDGVKGTIPELELMRQANKLMSTGALKSADDFGTLAEAARVLSHEGFGSVESVMGTVGNALQTGRVRSLALMGVTVDLHAAEVEFASSLGKTSSELSKSEKLFADRKAIMEAAEQIVRSSGVQESTLKERIEASRTSLKNWIDDLAASIAASPHVTAAYDAIQKAFADAFGNDSKKLAEEFLEWVNAAADVVTAYGPKIVEWLKAVADMVIRVWHTVEDAWDSLPDWLKEISKEALLAYAATVVAEKGVGALAGAFGKLPEQGADALSMAANIAQIWSVAGGWLIAAAANAKNFIAAFALVAQLGGVSGILVAIGEGLAALAVTPAGIIALIVGAGLALYRFYEAAKDLWDLWQRGKSMFDFFREGGGFWDNSAIGRALGMAKGVDAVTDALAKQAQAIQDVVAAKVKADEGTVGADGMIKPLTNSGSGFVAGATGETSEKTLRELAAMNAAVQKSMTEATQEGMTARISMAQIEAAEAMRSLKDRLKGEEIEEEEKDMLIEAQTRESAAKIYAIRAAAHRQTMEEIGKIDQDMLTTQIKQMGDSVTGKMAMIDASVAYEIAQKRKAMGATADFEAVKTAILAKADQDRAVILADHEAQVRKDAIATHEIIVDAMNKNALEIAKLNDTTMDWDHKLNLDGLAKAAQDIDDTATKAIRGLGPMMKGQETAYVSAVGAILSASAEMKDRLLYDYQAIHDQSGEYLRDQATRAWTTYDMMAGAPERFSQRAIKAQRDIAEAAERAAQGVGMSWSQSFENIASAIPGLVQQAFTGGGGVAGAAKAGGSMIGSELGKGLVSHLTDTGSKLISGTLGKVLGEAIPMVGSLIGPLLGKLFSAFGPSEAELEGRKIEKAFEDGFGGFQGMMDAVGKAYDATGRTAAQAQADVKALLDAEKNGGPAAQAAIEKINKAFADQKQHIADIKEGLGVATAGTNALAESLLAPLKALQDGLKSADDEDSFAAIMDKMALAVGNVQPQFEHLGQYVAATFAAKIHEGASAFDAFQSLAPSFQALQDGVEQFGLKSTATIDQLLSIQGVVGANADVFQSVQAVTQVYDGLTQSGYVTKDLFISFSQDITAQFDNLVARGADGTQAMMLMQPQLQKLWEGQEKFGLVTDEATQKMIEQAVQQGIVGEQQKGVNDKILDVLVSIADVFGAKLPASLNVLASTAAAATSSVQKSLDSIHAPVLPDINVNANVNWRGGDMPDYGGAMAAGGAGHVDRPTLFLAGEAGSEDYAFSGGGKSFGSGGGGGSDSTEALLRALPFMIGNAVRDGMQRAT